MRERIAMRRTPRLLSAAFALCVAGVLGGCSSIPTPSWDPTDLLNFLDNEKRTPGERKPVFPEGVPGVTQGVPQEMIKGNAQPEVAPETQTAAAPPAEAQPAPPPAKRSRSAARRAPAEAQVEIAPDDVNVGDPPPQRRQAQRPQRAPQPQAEPQANPFPAPLPR